MFDQFKTARRGLGPFQMIADSLSGGLLSHNRAAELAQQQWTALFDGIGADETLPESFRSDAARIRAQQWSLGDAVQLMEQFKQRAGTIKTVQDASATNGAQIDALYKTAMNDDDRAQLDTMRSTLDIATKYALSSNPQLQQLGQSLMIDTSKGLTTYATENEANRVAAETKYGQDNWTRFSSLRDDYRADSAAFVDQFAAFGRIKASLANDPSAAGDIALIFNYMKILDPASVVREGEFATAQNAAGVPQLVLTAYNQLLRDGQRLTPEQREDFFKQSVATFQQAKSEQVQRNSQYLDIARSFQLPEELLRNFALPTDSPGMDTQNFGKPEWAPAPYTGAYPQPAQTDSTARQIGDSARGGLRTFVERAADLGKGLFDIRDTDEYPPAPLKRAPEMSLAERLAQRNLDVAAIAARRRAQQRAKVEADSGGASVSGVIQR